MINFPNERFITENTVVLDQKSILDAFYSNVPLQKRKLFKFSAQRPKESSYRYINCNKEKDGSHQTCMLSQVQLISSFMDQNEPFSIFNQLRYSSTQQRNNSQEEPHIFLLGKRRFNSCQLQFDVNDECKIENGFGQNIQKNVIKKKKFLCGGSYKKTNYDSSSSFEQQSKCQTKAAAISTEEKEYSKLLKKFKVETKLEYKTEYLANELYQNDLQDQLTQIQRHTNSGLNKKNDLVLREVKINKQHQITEADAAQNDFTRMLIKLEDGRILEQVIHNKKELPEVSYWDNKELVLNIYQAQQSLNSFIQTKSRINSLSEHLQKLNDCIILTSSASVGNQIDKFFSTLNQSSTFFASTYQPSSAVHQNKIYQSSKKKFEIQKSPSPFLEIDSLIDVKQSNKYHEQQNSKNINTDDSLSLSEISNFQSDGLSSFKENLCEVSKYCSSLFKFQIKDSSLLKQFKFSKQKKTLAQQNERIEEESIEQDEGIQQSKTGEQIINQSHESSNKKQSIQILYESNNSKLKRYGKYHNLNKLFMYNVLNMYTNSNLYNFGVPESISNILQLVIQRLKISAKKYSNVNQKLPFNYFSHSHYNVLFLQLSQCNIKELKQQQEIVQLYKYCYSIDLIDDVIPHQLSYINLIKAYFFQIFIKCINYEDIQTEKAQKQDSRDLYTLKVVRGIRKLASGQIIKRF
ncbi:hypothetical protein TTHERM_00681850 (macronuclear) [Tetrahymena thermophila SB210]|uniref:Uncharacterized protein n=1 Tax=Tetrahymena thermophila (strain SB210) TaxID=312017 RepID=I7M4H9_TETTS|nr:hypothetical protein TTHERM_00681850 [Tetrahymena thermophila SB210]EAS07078.2 hypothetical protein TTHERM_00681850 [Tetrahymena thermophila SB210]|eukprot:XP_001027320.2 hypothetical protein TTHERM_00681850 [Tetrahymena thermophila SB210]